MESELEVRDERRCLQFGEPCTVNEVLYFLNALIVLFLAKDL